MCCAKEMMQRPRLPWLPWSSHGNQEHRFAPFHYPFYKTVLCMHVLACLLPDSKNNFLHQWHMARLTPD